jgi:predicted glycogen debranching enzyme
MTAADRSAYRWHWSGPTSAADLPALLSREWLDTNGLGGFASGTVAGPNTRRYHAVLIAATDPPGGRVTLVSALDESLVDDAGRTSLSTHLYAGGTVHPAGYLHIGGFEYLPCPRWTFQTPRHTLHKTLAMIHGRNTTVVRYELSRESAPAYLEVRLLLSGRDYHSLAHANDSGAPWSRVMSGLVYFPTYTGVPCVWLGHQGREFRSERTWYYRFDYPRERERGLEDQEDLVCTGTIVFKLYPGAAVHLAVGTDPVSGDDAAVLLDVELARRATWPLAADADPLVAELARAATPFLVQRGNGLGTVIAGYPWFTDWGRDTFISLPGLSLVTGQYETARQLLRAFAEHVCDGLIPNLFTDQGGADYNTIDGTLWYINALYRYICYTGDLELLRGGLFDLLSEIIGRHEAGTRYNIRVDPADGLLSGGADGVQLTWMDAKVGDHVVTPRRGKPVEIAALWYNALRCTAALARRLGRTDAAESYEAKAARTRDSFNARFWNPDQQCLYDVLGEHDVPDASVRPNQLFAVSLPFPVLDPARHAAVVETVERRLMTALGIRTLDPAHTEYRGRFEGDPWHRDHAYHQGTAWPWLLGPFVTAAVRAGGASPAARQRARQPLELLGQHLGEAGLGSVCEVSDGDPPQRPAGCFFQAWSVAEPLRALCEDVLGRAPQPASPTP